jgi:hypothetical protein
MSYFMNGVEAMKRITRYAAIAVLALGTSLWVMTTQAQQEGAATKAGEKIDEFGRAIRDEVQTAKETVREGITKTGDAIRDEYLKTRAAIHGMGLVPRIYGRLHWDKELHKSHFVLAANGGSVTVRGIVPNEASRQKAIALITDTISVTSVIDQLGVLSPE